MDSAAILEQIERIFPLVEMPLKTDFLFTKNNAEYAPLADDIEEFRGKNVTGNFIRVIHREMSHLSPKAWHWILPHYLRFCLTPEAEYNRMETEFLIYSLSPDLPFQADTIKRLSELNSAQISCLVDFLEWCSASQYWQEFCPKELSIAINFLGLIASKPRVKD